MLTNCSNTGKVRGAPMYRRYMYTRRHLQWLIRVTQLHSLIAVLVCDRHIARPQYMQAKSNHLSLKVPHGVVTRVPCILDPL
jgi:hypothetical protein